MDKSLACRPIFEDPGLDEESVLSNYAKVLAANTNIETLGENTRVLAFKHKAPLPKDGYQSSLKVLYSQQTGTCK